MTFLEFVNNHMFGVGFTVLVLGLIGHDTVVNVGNIIIRYRALSVGKTCRACEPEDESVEVDLEEEKAP